MDRVVVEHYLARAAAAASVRELHALAREVSRVHAGDPDAARRGPGGLEGAGRLGLTRRLKG